MIRADFSPNFKIFQDGENKVSIKNLQSPQNISGKSIDWTAILINWKFEFFFSNYFLKTTDRKKKLYKTKLYTYTT